MCVLILLTKIEEKNYEILLCSWTGIKLLPLCVVFVCFVVVMGVFMLPITVTSDDLFSPLDSSSPVVPFVLSLSLVA